MRSAVLLTKFLQRIQDVHLSQHAHANHLVLCQLKKKIVREDPKVLPLNRLKEANCIPTNMPPPLLKLLLEHKHHEAHIIINTKNKLHKGKEKKKVERKALDNNSTLSISTLGS